MSGGVSAATVAELAGVSVQAARLACRSGSLTAVRLPSAGWLIDHESAVRYAVESRTGAPPLAEPRRGDVALSLSPGEVRTAFLALHLAVRSTRRSRSQCPSCRHGACAEHPDRDRELSRLVELQRRLRAAAGQ